MNKFRPQSWFGYFVKNQLGDLLRAYAFEVTLVLSTGNLRKALLYGIVITIAAELFQLLPIVYATFDILDIIAQAAGVALAFIVSRRFYNHWLRLLPTLLHWADKAEIASSASSPPCATTTVRSKSRVLGRTAFAKQ